MSAKRQPVEQWRDRVRRWEESKLDAKAFAEREGVSWETLRRWRTEFAKRDGKPDAAPMVALARVVVREPMPHPNLEVAIGRYAVRIPVGFDLPTLAKVVAVLEGQS